MKKSVRLSIAAVCSVALLGGVSSCKKDKTEPTCRINTASTITSAGNSLLTLSYLSDGRLSSVTSTGVTSFNRTFTYSGNMINIIDRDTTGAVTATYDVTLNAQGNVNSAITKNATGAIQSSMSMIYDGNNRLQYLISSGTTGTDTTKVIVAEGNVTSTIANSDISVFSYYHDKYFMDGDYLKFIQMLNFGALYVVNRNLLKSIATNTTTTNIAYEFDNAGKIVKATVGDTTNMQTINYTYLCN